MNDHLEVEMYKFYEVFLISFTHDTQRLIISETRRMKDSKVVVNSHIQESGYGCFFYERCLFR